jgi:hypothetical protein
MRGSHLAGSLQRAPPNMDLGVFRFELKKPSPNEFLTTERASETTTQLNTPIHNPKHELGTIIEVTDPTHPLFGRKFPLISYSTQPDAQFALVAYQGNMTLRIALEATNLVFAQPRVSTRLTLAALEDLLSAAEEVLCPQSPAVSGSISPPNCEPPSWPNSQPPSRK